MVTKEGQYKVKLPTQYRTKKSKKKVLKKEGDKFNYQIIKCVVCGKQKMEKYDLKDCKGEYITINKCKNCKYTNASVVQVFTSDGNDPYHDPNVTYFNPGKRILEDKESS